MISSQSVEINDILTSQYNFINPELIVIHGDDDQPSRIGVSFTKFGPNSHPNPRYWEEEIGYVGLPNIDAWQSAVHIFPNNEQVYSCIVADNNYPNTFTGEFSIFDRQVDSNWDPNPWTDLNTEFNFEYASIQNGSVFYVYNGVKTIDDNYQYFLYTYESGTVTAPNQIYLSTHQPTNLSIAKADNSNSLRVASILNGNLKYNSDTIVNEVLVGDPSPNYGKIMTALRTAIAATTHQDFIIVYTNFDQSEARYRLYFVKTSNSGFDWSESQLVNPNFNYPQLQPSLVVDEDGNYYLSFLSVNEESNQVSLWVSTLLDGFENFNYPRLISNLGDYTGSMDSPGPGNFKISSKILPGIIPTVLKIASPKFDQSELNLQLTTVTFDTDPNIIFWNKVFDAENNLESNGEGLLLVDNIHEVNSGGDIPLVPMSTHSVKTLVETIDNFEDSGVDYKHHDWDNNNNEFKLIYSFDVGITDDEYTAKFLPVENVTINSDYTNSILLHDPWYIENPEANPSEWNQPDDFRPLSSQGDGNGNLMVFLDQNEDFIPNSPIYQLKAPLIGEITENAIYVFQYWESDPNVDYGNGINESKSLLETNVVFKSENAEVEAYYEDAVTAGLDVTIAEEDTLTLDQPGSMYTVPSQENGMLNFHFAVEGRLTIEGTEENPILFTTEDINDKWYGFYVDGENASLTLKHVIIENAANQWNTAIHVEHGSLIMENCIIRGSEKAVHIAEGANAYLKNNVFESAENGEEAGIFADITPNTQEVKIINNTIVGYDPGLNIELQENTLNRFKLVNNIVYHQNGNMGILNNFAHYGVDMDYNLVYGYSTPLHDAHEVLIHHEVNGDPLFTDNYHLQSNSPCIDTGDPDLDNDNLNWENDEDDRDPDYTRLDVGAHYFHQHPSIPSGFRVKGSPGQSPQLTWRMTEGDVHIIHVLRQLGDQDEFTLLAVVENESQYIDNTVTITNDKKFSQDACYKIKAVDDSEETSNETGPQCKAVEGPQDRRAALPTEFSLNNAYPNPFNPLTNIKYDLSEQSHVILTIFDLFGRKINTLKRKTEEAGYYSIKWDGTNKHGKPLSSGMYIINISALSMESDDTFTQSLKVVLLK